MIDGLKVTIPGTEVKRLIDAHVKYHRERAKAYVAQLGAFDDVAQEAMSKLSGSPVEALKTKAKAHEDDATELEFIGKWLDVSTLYQLSRPDLARLGVMRSGY